MCGRQHRHGKRLSPCVAFCWGMPFPHCIAHHPIDQCRSAQVHVPPRCWPACHSSLLPTPTYARCACWEAYANCSTAGSVCDFLSPSAAVLWSTSLESVQHTSPLAPSTQGGGRIFYPAATADLPTAAPLVEDMAWRQRQVAAGPPGQDGVPPPQRTGRLWQFYAQLAEGAPPGLKTDAQSYTTAFRVKGPPEAVAAAMAELPDGLATALNLGAADVFPATSGKARCLLNDRWRHWWAACTGHHHDIRFPTARPAATNSLRSCPYLPPSSALYAALCRRMRRATWRSGLVLHWLIAHSCVVSGAAPCFSFIWFILLHV